MTIELKKKKKEKVRKKNYNKDRIFNFIRLSNKRDQYITAK